MKRAIRRHHRSRLKNNRKNYYGHDEAWNDPMTEGQLGVVVSTVPSCSCPMCGNPRRHFKQITRSEQLGQINFIEQLEECDIHHPHSLPRKGEGW